MEVVGPKDTLVVSPLNVSVATILPVIVDGQSHGRDQGVLNGHSLTIRASGNGNVNVLDSHQQPVATVSSGASKSFTAEGNEVGNRWIVQ